jgi:uncharacterized protein YdeI (YjbR/CyaY-like superfamily)
MAERDSRVDAYIGNAAPFAQPVLRHIQGLVHAACPEVEETIKWGFPHFEYKGILCSMAAFKSHCAFGFWRGTELDDPHQLLSRIGETAMGQLGKIRDVADLPPDEIFTAYIHEAMRQKEQPRPPAEAKSKNVERKELPVPEDLRDALQSNSKARATFEAFSYTNRKDYIDWITEAKTPATRLKRLETAVEWMEEGKIRNWKYMKKQQ